MVGAVGVPPQFLQAAGHVVAQVAPQLDRVPLGDEGGALLAPVPALLQVGGQLVARAVPVGLAVQREVGPQRRGVAAQLAVAAAGHQGAPLGLGQRARGVQVLLHGLQGVGGEAGADKALKDALEEGRGGRQAWSWRGGGRRRRRGGQRGPQGDRLLRGLLTGQPHVQGELGA